MQRKLTVVRHLISSGFTWFVRNPWNSTFNFFWAHILNFRNSEFEEVKLNDTNVKKKLDFSKPINFLIHGFMADLGIFSRAIILLLRAIKAISLQNHFSFIKNATPWYLYTNRFYCISISQLFSYRKMWNIILTDWNAIKTIEIFMKFRKTTTRFRHIMHFSFNSEMYSTIFPTALKL